MKSNKSLIILAGIGILALAFLTSVFVVDETEQVVITQFGRVVGELITEPGLNFKVPLIHKVNRFPKNLLHWDGDPGQIPTLDKTYIWVDTFARWKIVDPVLFLQTVKDVPIALSRLDNIIDPAVRNYVTSYPLIEAVRKSNRELDTFEAGVDSEDRRQSPATYSVTTGRQRINQAIMKAAMPKLAQFGIELVDVKIKRINYVEQVRESVYGRMIAERKQIAEKFRAEGHGEAQKIIGEKERDLKQITSQAYKAAQEIMGKADAEATRVYAEAYSLDPEFYSFTKTMETYAQTMDDKSALVLSTDSEFFKYLKQISGK